MQVVYDVGSWRITDDGQVYRRGKLRFANGDLYDGEWMDGKRHGQGKFTYQNGSTYTGELVANLYNGCGVLVVADAKHPFTGKWVKGSTYDGQFQRGKKHGKGLVVFGEGGSYDGMFHDNAFHGDGLRCYANGDRYEGEWRHGSWWGLGHLRRVDGESYRGECKRGLFHTGALGVGRRTFRRGHGSYEGGYRDGLQHGKGLRVFADGSSYEGDWVDNVMHGNGVWSTAAFTYIGEFQHDRPHGHGLFTFTNGDVYEGSVREGHFYGRGKYTYKDGSWYDGEYMATTTTMTSNTAKQQTVKEVPLPNGLKHGQGRRRWVNGNEYDGEWKDDAMHGQGRLTVTYTTNGCALRTEYDGAFANGRPSGHGTLKAWNPDGICMEFPSASGNWYRGRGTCTYTGDFANGLFHGQGTLTTCDGRRYEGSWQRGKRHGHGRSDLIPLVEQGDEARMHIKGSSALYRIARYDGMHEQDKRQGFGKAYFSNGESIEGTFVNGQADGIATYVYTSGKRRRGSWKLGQRVAWLSNDDDAKWAGVDKAVDLSMAAFSRRKSSCDLERTTT
ncbi:hypothetical protein H310_07029 [Aphanomyces invadans]|uniref:Uncharacterized protein n=1 Tax=Aphanomyces invadans TaxID=157072 RepID=A0A024U1W9_9STRA|nr:hypothetical protein H310_07029 [Aphanomyces invadans]ETW00391.1 hypothetical protein H310_07029 [Aphanomyces invadans]|eukprot:XP_008870526.1 hypothetical protein H310_07029 [Aphanomyces invadans]